MVNSVYSHNAEPINTFMAWVRMFNCTVVSNDSSAIHFAADYTGFRFRIERCILAFNEGSALVMPGMGPMPDAFAVSCCNIFENEGVVFEFDTTGIQVDRLYEVDPLFCDTGANNYRIYDNSTCAPENNTCDTLIGAHGIGCSCCMLRGDLDGNIGVTVSDLTFLVAYLFPSGPLTECSEHVDVDGSSAVNVADLTYLVAFIFQGGPLPPPCP